MLLFFFLQSKFCVQLQDNKREHCRRDGFYDGQNVVYRILSRDAKRPTTVLSLYVAKSGVGEGTTSQS